MIHFPKTASDAIESELAHEKSLASGKYGLNSVWLQLKDDFFKKCYICEDKTKSPRIEHFRPKVISKDLEFDWNNFFLSCEHCNAIKSDKYRQLIDCSIEFPDQEIRFAVAPIGAIGSRVIIQQLPSSTIHIDTVNLLNEIYSGTTTCKQIGAEAIFEDLLEEINDFDDLVKKYIESKDAEMFDDLIWEVNNESKFTAFKRWLVKDTPVYKIILEQHFKN